MRTLYVLVLLVMCAPAIAQDQLSNFHANTGKVSIGDPISKVQASLGKPSRTYEVQNAYGGVVEFDYVWENGGSEITFVVTLDGFITSIWQSETG